MLDKIFNSDGDIIFIYLARCIFFVITVGLIVTSLISICFGFNILWDTLVETQTLMAPVTPLSEMEPGYVNVIVANTLGLIGFMGAFLFIFFGYGFNEKREEKDTVMALKNLYNCD